MTQETCPDNCQVKVLSACQLVCQVTSQLNSKEGTQLKRQRNFQFLIQGPHQLIFQKDSIRHHISFSRDMASIMPVSPGFGYSNRYSSEITTANEATFGVKTQTYHANNGAINTESVALDLNIKTGYISLQFYIVFGDEFTTTSTRITNKLSDNCDDFSTTIVNCHQMNSNSA